ncbi:alpha/beta fold hydrolase [Haloarchaeobius sp. TZWWS8]|uniref:alpha/beta fold hydrolase n=1 Tax=Haloarchaeobius sp. TZWWS8 TaxID=3446121 RepID=UPI003EB842D3
MIFTPVTSWPSPWWPTVDRTPSTDEPAAGGATPSEVVYTENKVRLHHYEARGSRRQTVPILLVYAVINRPSVLDFQPDRSVVRQFVERGFDVYLVDWGEPSRLDTSLDLDDFVTRYLANCVDVVRERAGVDAVHLFGYCSGATLAAIFAALYPERVQTLGLLAPVLNFDVEGGIFDLPDTTAARDPQTLVETVGNARGDALAVGFTLTDPVEYHLGRYLRLADHLDDPASLRYRLRRLEWGADCVDVAGALFGQFLVDLYRENRLMEGSLTVGGRPVDRAALEMPVLTVLGTDDEFIPAAAGLPFVETLPDVETIGFPTDHIGLSTGERAHAELWPRVCDWLEAHGAAAAAS